MTTKSTSAPTLRLVDRLRGIYTIPVNDGAGPLNGSDTFTREFETPPIQKEAAAVIDAMTEGLEGLLSVVDAFHDFCRDPKRPCGEYGVECPISMGEWIEDADRDAVTNARAALSLSKEI